MAPKRRPAPAAGSKPSPKPASANSSAQKGIGFLPPGAKNNYHRAHADRRDDFEYRFDEHVPVPPRLCSVPSSLVEAVNDFHFAMMNDTPRNAFYYNLLKKHIVPGETTVLEIGAGSGLLSMMAAQLGAKWVVAVEGSTEMSNLARANIRNNQMEDKITVLNMLSTELKKKHLPGTPDVLVSEIFGTLLLGESALDYIVDVRDRILGDNPIIIPQHGIQYAVPICCPALEKICTVSEWNGINLSHVMALQDTASTVFTKQYGFRLSSMPFTRLCEPVPLVTVDFAKTKRNELQRDFPVNVTATESGTAHAWMYYFHAFEGDELLSTAPEDNVDNFPRDMQWGQALQLIDAGSSDCMPTALKMEKGETHTFRCTLSDDRVVVHMNYKFRAKKEEDAAAKS